MVVKEITREIERKLGPVLENYAFKPLGGALYARVSEEEKHYAGDEDECQPCH